VNMPALSRLRSTAIPVTCARTLGASTRPPSLTSKPGCADSFLSREAIRVSSSNEFWDLQDLSGFKAARVVNAVGLCDLAPLARIVVHLRRYAAQGVVALYNSRGKVRVGLAPIFLPCQKLREGDGDVGSERTATAVKEGELLFQVADDAAEGEVGVGGRNVAPRNIADRRAILLSLDARQFDKFVG